MKELKKELKAVKENYLTAKANNDYANEVDKKVKDETLKRYEYYNAETGKRLAKSYEDFLMSDEALDDYFNKIKLIYNELYQKELNKNFEEFEDVLYGDELKKAEKELMSFAPKFLIQFGRTKEANIYTEAIKNNTLTLNVKKQLIDLTLRLSI